MLVKPRIHLRSFNEPFDGTRNDKSWYDLFPFYNVLPKSLSILIFDHSLTNEIVRYARLFLFFKTICFRKEKQKHTPGYREHLL
jgi:hypothetical protein